MELVANFELNNESLDAEFEMSDSANLDALFQIDSQLEVVGDGVINVTTANGKAVVTSTTFIHEQGIASDTWVINHNLNKFPSIYVVDTAGHSQMPDDIEVNDMNTITVRFLAAFSGFAYLN